LDIHNPQNCSERFKSSRNIGWLVFLGIIGSGIYSKSKNNNNNNSKDIISSIPFQIANHNNDGKMNAINSSPSYTSRIELKNS
jgi:hypothetical protein